MLAQYNELIPNYGDRVVAIWEKTASAQADRVRDDGKANLESVRGHNKNVARGQYLFVLLVVLVLGFTWVAGKYLPVVLAYLSGVGVMILLLGQAFSPIFRKRNDPK